MNYFDSVNFIWARFSRRSIHTGNIARQTMTIPGMSFVQTYKYDSLYRITEARETAGGVLGGVSAAAAAGAGGVVCAGTVVGEALLAGQGIRQNAEAGQEAAIMANIESDRRYAVDQAWKQEAELVRQTGQGTVEWTPAQIKKLLDTGRVQGYEGHHSNSVNGHPEQARNPNKVRFVNGRTQHLQLHDGNWRNPTEGPLMNRRPR